MTNRNTSPRKRRDLDDVDDDVGRDRRRPRIDPDERDEYDNWRQERGTRGRKRRDKAGGRHRRPRDTDEF